VKHARRVIIFNISRGRCFQIIVRDYPVRISERTRIIFTKYSGSFRQAFLTIAGKPLETGHLISSSLFFYIESIIFCCGSYMTFKRIANKQVTKLFGITWNNYKPVNFSKNKNNLKEDKIRKQHKELKKKAKKEGIIFSCEF